MKDKEIKSKLSFFTLPELKMLPLEVAQKIVRLMVEAKEWEDWVILDHGDVPMSFQDNFGFDPGEILKDG